MEQRIAELEMRNDEIWDLLEDPELPPLDRQQLNQEMLSNSIQILVLEDQMDDDETLSCASSETIGADEYDREGLIVNEDFDLADEV